MRNGAMARIPVGGGAEGRGSGGGRGDSLGRHLGALYGQRQDYNGMARTVRDMVAETKTRINALVVRSDDLEGTLESWTPRRYAATVKSLGGKTVLGLERRGMPPGPGAARLRIAIAEIPGSPNHYCAVSDCKSAQFNGVFMPFISMHTPDISRLFLANKDMAGILDSIESQGYSVGIKHGSARGRERPAGAPESGTRSTTTSIGAFFAGLDEAARAAITVRYAASPSSPDRRGGRAELRGTVGRDCRFSASGGAEVLFKAIIPRALSLPRERNRLIEASARSAGSDAVEPTVIRFGGKIFRDRDANRRHVGMIAKMACISISEYHVDSYIHLSLVDYTDGSSYDIWVVTGDRLAIIPQIRASGASLRRLVNHILEHIGEGRVERYER